ncbi:uncharacterized protein Pyn_38292 [Prunus yedoensis var. nudiflora]|uniref:Aminotransferase-like plant mobile domain-containing protein n=1 Tax=Prunus yedoensis var. nudiflora TaxID=2094558 RepID=A0A314YE51_PRUYE|nr:uncharacterized protein Pyn_38292 [Prunus yedoensis var. nudiflora]
MCSLFFLVQVATSLIHTGVANILHLPLCGSQDPFHITLTPEDKLKLKALRKGAPTSPSTSLRFSNWIQFFGDVNRNEPCRLAAFISLWLGRFLFCDFSQDCLHARVFPLALAVARGDMIPLAPMFLGHLYRLLDQVQFLEKGAAGTMAVETLLNSSFLQVFLWEQFKGIEVSLHPYSKVKESADSDGGSYVPEKLPMICRWFRRMQRKDQNFLELLDNVESFIFRPYCALSAGFRHVPLYADSDDLIEVPATTARGRRLRREALLSAARFPLPTLGDDHLEASVYYGAHRVRRQLGFDQGVPSDPNHWTAGNVPEDGNLFALALADKGRVGGLSKAYRSYWNRCFASFSRFHAAHCDRSGEIVGNFSKLKQKLEKPSSRSAGKGAAYGKRKREESPSVGKKRHAAKSPKRFIPKVAASGPPSSKRNAPTVPLLQQQPVASVSSKQVDKMPEAAPSRNSGSDVVVVADDDDDDGSNEDDAVGTGISIHEQGSTHSTNGTDEDLDKDQYYSRDEGTYPDANAHSEERDTSDMPPGFASSLEQHMNLEPVVLTAVDTTYPSSAVGPSLPTADTTQTADEVEGAPQGAEGVPFTPPIDVVATITPHLPATTIPTLAPLDIATSTTPDLPASSIPASALLDIAASTTPDLPTASTPASALLDIATGTTPDLPAASIPGDVLDERRLPGFGFGASRDGHHGTYGHYGSPAPLLARCDLMRSLPGPDEIKAAADALNLKQRELEDHYCEFQTLLLARGVSIDSAECVAEAAARSSLKASSVFFGNSS